MSFIWLHSTLAEKRNDYSESNNLEQRGPEGLYRQAPARSARHRGEAWSPGRLSVLLSYSRMYSMQKQEGKNNSRKQLCGAGEAAGNCARTISKAPMEALTRGLQGMGEVTSAGIAILFTIITFFSL